MFICTQSRTFYSCLCRSHRFKKVRVKRQHLRPKPPPSALHLKMAVVPHSRGPLRLPRPAGDWKQRWLACSNDGEPGSIVLTPPLSSAPICHHSAGWSCLQCFAPQMRWIISCPSQMLYSSHPWLLSPSCSWQFWHLVISLLLLHLDPYPPFYSLSFCHP